jgi:RNA polymerase primary sigma factor
MKRVDHAEEIELCRLAQNGSKDAMDTMVESNLGLVAKIANKFYVKNEQFTFDDLFQEGVFGLIRAIQKFDPSEGCRFSTYAYYWIYASVSRFSVNSRGKIRIPSHVYESLRKAKDETELVKLKSKIPAVTSLSKLIGENLRIEDIIPNQIDEDPEEVLNNEMMLDQIRSLISEKEYLILSYRYGLDGKNALSQRECAKIFNVSHSAIYLSEKKTISKLKSLLSQ